MFTFLVKAYRRGLGLSGLLFVCVFVVVEVGGFEGRAHMPTFLNISPFDKAKGGILSTLAPILLSLAGEGGGYGGWC